MENKPNWKDAPEWAKFLAMDENYEWWWYELEPYFIDGLGFWNSLGRSEIAKSLRAKETLEERPQ